MLLKLPPVALSPTRMLMRGVYAQRSCLFAHPGREKALQHHLMLKALVLSAKLINSTNTVD